ncbi:succinate-semialdehyde dehdyrogenase [Stylonychia lemnae]|uniref:Succinate-semialdehyde dehdyrogenase n=1 Tax=Stylonychia lemnae TaxID=5949 RepID=A0A078AIW8_STYLE|nr:succinate-semialdehyde dehdyrogenase [Stylonychia lemnae]|eukprot:CDW82260.1 succinate-semialdehyde dehdyrogenase [Stylonychia lemnae]
MAFRSINPKNNKLFMSYEAITNQQMFEHLEKSYKSYKYMRNQGREGFDERFSKFQKLISLMKDRKEKIALGITNDMGKPLKESIAEVEKSMGLVEYYIKNTRDLAADEILQTRFPETTVRNQPLGPTLRNPILLKHSDQVPQSANNLDLLFRDSQTFSLIIVFSGFDNGEFTNLFIDHNQAADLIADPRLTSVKFVGSTQGGKKVAELCGRHMKKSVFELGGSDAFIVLEDADLDLAVQKAIIARLHTSGQACNNAKRFMIHAQVYDEFVQKLKAGLDKHIKIGDPLDMTTTIGPLSSQRAKEGLTNQIQKSLQNGAKIIYGNLEYEHPNEELKNGNYFHPLVLENITKDQPAYCEELFGPVFSLFKIKSDHDAIDLANDSIYGLSASVFTQNIQRGRQAASFLEVGNVFINEAVSSDAAIPGGGVKESGFGRECYKDGLFETVNRKAVIVGKL